MLRVKDYSTAWWGRVRTASEPYPCHPRVNAFVGASGGGKTTQMDALRLCLGDAKFENNRPMDHYIHPRANWAVVRVAFWNRKEDGPPFASEGYRQDEVTVCVRLDRSKGTCERDYYVFDGPFFELNDLGKNPRLYRERNIPYREYLDLLERIGITRAFRQLMMMSPDDVREVVNMPPHRLFDLVFNLKGTKRIQQNHDDARRKLQEAQFEETNSQRELEQAQMKLVKFEEAKRLFEENEARRKDATRTSTLLLKLNWWDTKETRAREAQDQVAAIHERDRLQEQIRNLDAEITQLGKELQDAATKRLKHKDREETIGKEKQDWAVELSRLTREREKKHAELQSLLAIPEEEMEPIQRQLAELREQAGQARGAMSTTATEITRLTQEIAAIDNGQGGIPRWVTEYQRGLESAGVQGVLLADCLSVRKEYEPWLKAIEARLGLDRYRIVVPSAQYLTAKKLQEEIRYRARVSPPRAARHPRQPRLLHGKYPSIRQALDVEHVDQVGGFLDHLDRIYLVDTVEEGHALQQEGHTTLTKRGLLQDDDGSLFLETKEFVCGRLARERHRQVLVDALSNATTLHTQATEQAHALEKQVQALDKRLADQERRSLLPHVDEEWRTLSTDEKTASDEVARLEKEWGEVRQEIERLWTVFSNLKGEKTGKEGELRELREKHDDRERQIMGYRNRLTQLQNELEVAEAELRAAGFDEHAIGWIDQEANEGLFNRSDDTPWTRADLKAHLQILQRQIELFEIQHSDINQGTIAMVEPQKDHIRVLQKMTDDARLEREEWEARLSEAETALRHHVKETMEQYIEEFRALAGLLGADVKGRFEQEGNSPEQWRLVLKIGFNGKEPAAYYEPGLSSGERAVVSIMLLLAAVNNRKENQRTSIMFLDEPTARVDDERANEVGLLLQLTDIQYFITHQTSASLVSVDWIDHAFVTSKLRPGEDFANDIIFEARRVVE